MAYTLKEVAQALGEKFLGQENQEIEGVASFDRAGPGDLTFLADERLIPQLKDCPAGAIIVPAPLEKMGEGKNLLLSSNPALAFIKAIEFILKPYDRPVMGVSEKALVEDSAQIGENVSLYPGCYIGRGVKIGNRVRVYPGAYIGDESVVGDDSVIFANVSIYEKSILGQRCIVHSGAVIGADGFGFIFHQGVHHKFPQVGRVVIEDDVEIGANTTIDRATLGETRVGRGTKMDNQVQVGHNIEMGQGCLLVAQVGIGGSTKLGNYVVLGGQVAVKDHVELGDGVQVAAQAGVTKNFPTGTILFGSPAYPVGEGKRLVALTRSLPKLKKRIEELEEKIRSLEKKEE